MDHETTKTTRLHAIDILQIEKKPYLVVMAGEDIGRRFLLDRVLSTIGRTADADIVLNDAKISRQHARIRIDNVMTIEDLQSTNGTFVNNKAVSTWQLQDGDFINVGGTILKFSYQSEIESHFHEEIIDSARNDGLTGLVNRRFFHRYLESEFSRLARYGGIISVLLCDLDNFKQINDTYGHPAGDRVLQRTARTLQSCIRDKVDVAGRLGGEEFAVLLPATALPKALTTAERIRAAIAALDIDYEAHALRFTVSIGAAASNPDHHTIDDLLKQADENLYLAKKQGKNRVAG